MALLDIRAPTEQTEGTRLQVLRWLKAVGDVVADQEPLLELETDKVTVEVSSPGAGVLREALKTAAEEITAGELLGRIEIGAVTPVVPDAREAPPTPAAAQRAEVPALAERDAGRELLSPAVRRLLAERGLAASAIKGTGTHGRITVADVHAHSAGTPPRVAVPQAKPRSVPLGVPLRVPHSLMRKQIAAHMVHSLLHTAPHVTTVFEADLGAVLAHRERHRDEFARDGGLPTLTTYFIAASIAAIRAVPETNSRWTDEALEVFEHIDVGVATAIEGKGLVVPVIRDAAPLDLRGIAGKLADLTSRARSHRLTADDVRDGTFTISNHGVSGSLIATPIIINQPQSAILGIGKLEKRVVALEAAAGDVIAVRRRCYVSLTVDHRVLDGHLANRFLQAFVEHLEAWPL